MYGENWKHIKGQENRPKCIELFTYTVINMSVLPKLISKVNRKFQKGIPLSLKGTEKPRKV